MFRAIPGSIPVGLLLTIFAKALCGRAVEAQDPFKVIDPYPSIYVQADDPPEVVREKQRKEREAITKINDILQGKLPLAENQSFFDKWYSLFVFAKMTLYTPEALEAARLEREKFLLKNLQTSTNELAHTHLVEHTFAEMKKIAEDTYHPAARYNAVLIIGELNEKEAIRHPTSGAAPDPYIPALGYMLDMLEDPKQTDANKLGAWVGIVRHCYYEGLNKAKSPTAKIPPPVYTRLRTTAQKLVNTRKAPGKLSQDGHDWMRRRAAEALGWLAASKPDPETIALLVARIGDPTENRGVRLQCTEALVEASYQPPVAVKTLEAAGKIAKCLAENAEADAVRLETWRKETEEIKKALQAGGVGPGGPGGRIPGGRGDGGGGPGGIIIGAVDDYAYRIDPIRRRLKNEAVASITAILGAEDFRRPNTNNKGLITGAKEADKKKLSEGVKALIEFSKAMESKTFETDDFIVVLRQNAEKIARLEALAAVAPPADEAGAAAPDAAPPAKVAEPDPAPKAKAPLDDLPE